MYYWICTAIYRSYLILEIIYPLQMFVFEHYRKTDALHHNAPVRVLKRGTQLFQITATVEVKNGQGVRWN